ncbi:MAG: helix-turn-helix transcriptional regulator [Clostridia bacterium]|nr:helix-turn-helix transcriptional regulator [Clostridia bacterium]
MSENKFVYDNLYTFDERKQLIAESLKSIRVAKRLTQKQVAEHIGVNTQTYATYERGRNEPPAEIIIRLSYLYNIPTDLILQKDNVTKEKSTVMKQLDDFDAVIDEMRGKILSGDAETRKEIGRLADNLGKFVEIIRDFEERED